MRRPRSKLQVTTFPFLAVLLCAMGSLLLLLFVMDRRAKIAAQHQVSEEVEMRKKRSKAEEDERQAEWEQAQAKLHNALAAQGSQVAGESAQVLEKIDAADKKLSVAQAKNAELRERIQQEAVKIKSLRAALIDDAARNDAAKKVKTSQADLLEATKELAELEEAFRRLRALKDREKQTYSVVPYRGKHGDTRAPIYVVCLRDGVVFQPDGKLLAGWAFSAQTLHEEVERRHGPLTVPKVSIGMKSPKADETKGPYVLFLIRPDGIDAYYKAQAALRGYQLDFGYELVDQHWVLDFGGDGKAKDVASSKPATPLETAPPLLPPGGFAKNGADQAPSAGPLTGGRGAGPTLPPRPGGNGGTGNPLTAPPLGFTDRPVTGIVPRKPNAGPSFVPIQNPPPLVPIASSRGLKKPVAPESVANPSAANTAPPPRVDAVQTQRRPMEHNPASTGNGNEPADPFTKPLPPLADGSAKKQTAPAPRLRPSKDFVITIDCQNDSVTVLPGGMTFRWTESNLKATDRALAETVANLISRRQASVRPGEPTWRPLIRFQVQPEGLRTYLHAYPLLEPLRVPMTRENVRE